MCFEVVGYLLEELRDQKNLEAFKKDVEEANIFIGSLIFIEELAEKVRSAGALLSQPHSQECSRSRPTADGFQKRASPRLPVSPCRSPPLWSPCATG